MGASPAVIALLLAFTLVALVMALSVNRETMRRTGEIEASARGDERIDRFGERRRKLNGWFRRTRAGAYIDPRLAGADVRLGAFDFVVVATLSGLLLGWLARGFLGNLGAVVLVAAVVVSADKWLDRRRQQRVVAFIGQLPDLARLLANATGAGLALRTAVDLVVRELPDPASTEFREVQRQMSLGHSLNDALADLNTRLPSRDLEVLIRTLLVQSQAGGRLSTSLTTIAATLDERRELERELRNSVSGAVFSGYTVLLIGVGAIFLMNLVQPGSLDTLATTLLGQIVLLVSGSMFVLGVILIRRITKVEI